MCTRRDKSAGTGSCAAPPLRVCLCAPSVCRSDLCPLRSHCVWRGPPHPQGPVSGRQRPCFAAGDGVQRPHEPQVRRILSLHARARGHIRGHMSAVRTHRQTRAPTRCSQVPLLSCRLVCPSGCSTHMHARSHGGTRLRAHEHPLHRPAAGPLPASSRSVPSPFSLILSLTTLGNPSAGGSGWRTIIFPRSRRRCSTASRASSTSRPLPPRTRTHVHMHARTRH